MEQSQNFLTFIEPTVHRGEENRAYGEDRADSWQHGISFN